MTKNDDKRIPALRFKGFNDDWAQRKLGDYITVNKIKNKENNHFIPYSISNKWGFIPQEKQFGEGNTYSKTNKATNYIVEPNTFAYNPARINVGSIAYQNNQFPVIVSSLYEIFKAKKNLNDEFLMNWFKTEKFTRQIQKLQEGGVRQYFFIDKMQESRITIPFISEQEEISKTLNQISNLIKLQQRKLEQLKLVKKALLQDLFTSKEASILRFKGFSGKWEKHKLGDFGTVAMNKRIFKNQTTETGDIPFYKIGTFGKKADSFISRKLFEQYKKRYPYPQKGDLLISASGSIGRIIEYKGEAAYYQDSNIVWLNHNNKLLNSFLKAYYQIIHWDGIEGSTIKRLYNKNILLTKIYLPTLKEQQEIGVLFKVIDEEIDLQQKRISKLQTIKQFLLQNMFI